MPETNPGGIKMRTACLVSVAAMAACLSMSARAQNLDYNKIEILTEQVASNLYMLSGSSGLDPAHEDAAGGRIGVLAGPDGIFMVDAQYGQLGDKVLGAVRRISSAPIRFLVNTHIHRDHTGGNAAFAKMGAVIFAREELRQGMVRAGSANAVAGDAAGLPVVTYGLGEPVKLHMNGETIDLIAVRAAHTGGDTIIRFDNANAIMIGDYYRNFGYPFIDLANGGSLKGMLEALDFTMKVAGPDTRLIPGHGTLVKRADLIPYRDMISAVAGKVRDLVAQGKSQQDVLAAHVTAPYDGTVQGGLLPAAGSASSADRFVTELYQDLKGGR
jgi:glyoxylase-like metal-dependent hydrolase (beta-lactamase superfamily II)